MEDVKLKVFNKIKEINESRTLAKYISCECRCEFDGRKCNSRQKWNIDECHSAHKNPIRHNSSEEESALKPSK